MTLLKHKLSYQADTMNLFALISDKPWAMLLDSGQPHSQYGRYDILVADPFMTLSTVEDASGVHTRIQQSEKLTISGEDPFAILNNALAPYRAEPDELPFVGGAVGYFGYDLARQIENLPSLAQDPGLPTMMVGLYDCAVVVDHREKTSHLVSHGFQASTREQ